MKLYITNFRHIEERVYTISEGDVGMVLLYGKGDFVSVYDAMMECLYGSWVDEEYEELMISEWYEIDVIRTRRSLIVETETDRLEDEVAQNYINDRFGIATRKFNHPETIKRLSVIEDERQVTTWNIESNINDISRLQSKINAITTALKATADVVFSDEMTDAISSITSDITRYQEELLQLEVRMGDREMLQTRLELLGAEDDDDSNTVDKYYDTYLEAEDIKQQLSEIGNGVDERRIYITALRQEAELDSFDELYEKWKILKDPEELKQMKIRWDQSRSNIEEIVYDASKIGIEGTLNEIIHQLRELNDDDYKPWLRVLVGNEPYLRLNPYNLMTMEEYEAVNKAVAARRQLEGLVVTADDNTNLKNRLRLLLSRLPKSYSPPSSEDVIYTENRELMVKKLRDEIDVLDEKMVDPAMLHNRIRSLKMKKNRMMEEYIDQQTIITMNSKQKKYIESIERMKAENEEYTSQIELLDTIETLILEADTKFTHSDDSPIKFIHDVIQHLTDDEYDEMMERLQIESRDRIVIITSPRMSGTVTGNFDMVISI